MITGVEMIMDMDKFLAHLIQNFKFKKKINSKFFYREGQKLACERTHYHP